MSSGILDIVLIVKLTLHVNFTTVTVKMQKQSLLTTNPELASEWHPTKNGQLTPADVTAGSDKKVWWKCPKGSDHEWDAKIQERSRGNGCPICSNRRVVRSNSLGFTSPELSKQWHPTKNGTLTPANVTASSGRKVWWKCTKGSDHEWQATPCNRVRGKTGCPYCAGKKVLAKDSLGSKHPFLVKEWHQKYNGVLSMKTAASGEASRGGGVAFESWIGYPNHL